MSFTRTYRAGTLIFAAIALIGKLTDGDGANIFVSTVLSIVFGLYWFASRSFHKAYRQK